jgi:SAM-dependent methyltransferase
MIEAVHISEGHEITRGDVARSMVSSENDARYLTEYGVTSVTQERWQAAQRYEKKCWLEMHKDYVDDRNMLHEMVFDEYTMLDGLEFEKVIEVGCGPFTNLRRILNLIKKPQSVDLLDPLVAEYLQHPHCKYKNMTLRGVPTNLISLPLEKYAPGEMYDLVVCINVLEHCFDAIAGMNSIYDMLKVGGTIIFSEKFFKCVDILVGLQYDCGHPIRLGELAIDSFITRFDMVVGRILECG